MDDLVVLRTYLRHREALIEDRATHVHRMPKELALMNVRLTEVVSDITGMTGMDIVRAIAAGPCPQVLESASPPPGICGRPTDLVSEQWSSADESRIYD
jgi:hypothetical protein